MTEDEIETSASPVGGSSPKYSPDGEWILYVSQVGELRTVHRMSVADTINEELFSYEGYLCCANYSRDGKFITFNIGNPDLDILIMDADGSNLDAVTDNQIHDGGPSWTYDNTRLVFTSVHNGNFEMAGVYTIEPDGSDKTRVHSVDFRAYDPVWSHNNQFVLAQHVENDNVDFYKIEVSTGETTRMTESDSADWYPTWSPDDTKIAYRNNESGNWDIYLMNVDGSKRERLTDPSTEDHSPIFSPDGRYIAYISRPSDSGPFDIWIMYADGSFQKNLTKDKFDNQSPSWAADSRSLLYSSVVNGQSQVMKVKIDGTGKSLLTRSQ